MTETQHLSIPQVVGANIARLRGEQSMAQFGESLADTLGTAWTRQSVWQAERGMRAFTAQELVAIALTLDAPLIELFRTDTPVDMPTAVLRSEDFESLLGESRDMSRRSERLRGTLEALRRQTAISSQATAAQVTLVGALESILSGRPTPTSLRDLREALRVLDDEDER